MWPAFGDPDVHRPLRRIEERAGFEQIERGPNRRRVEGCTGRLVMAAPQPSPKPIAADRPRLTSAIDGDISKGGARGGVEQLAGQAGACKIDEHGATVAR